MRKIKFRAWDKEQGSMYNKMYVEPNSRLLIIENEEKLHITFKEAFENIEKYILMQYTGLKDKTGKEIYEGDILKYSDEIGAKGRGCVEFFNGCFVISCGYQCLNELLLTEHWEVRGNICENPELLGGEE